MALYTNKLIGETSPYLLQHAHNPVNWEPWSSEILTHAEKEGKLILVSIGYAACHWCHVMEKECFEDSEVAEIMNKHFICVKVDREERPDVDHYYMTAIQLMHQQGGWPLNIIALPDGRPIWGGTYFPREKWQVNILAVAEFYQNNKEKTIEYANAVQHGIEQVSLIKENGQGGDVSRHILNEAVTKLKPRLDRKKGGSLGQPKFPMPVNLDFLLYYGVQANDHDLLGYLKTTLSSMARGGIYDQVGGGFARYSVDDKWKVPHFEKMLYDNAQLLSAYSQAYQVFGESEFRKVVYETIAFLEREMKHLDGVFFSSLDADSEGEEGKFYVWKKQELQHLIGADFELFSAYFNINKNGYWEDGNYILLRDKNEVDFAKEWGITLEMLQGKVASWKSILLKYRETRPRPGLDDKSLTSWNAFVILGLADAYKAFGDDEFIKLSERTALFLVQNVADNDGKVYHSWKNGKKTVDGFLEDYSFLIKAFISLFEITGKEEWLEKALLLTGYTFAKFYDRNSGFFFFSERGRKGLTNHFQNDDNVIPSANSEMAHNLHALYLLTGDKKYLDTLEKMIKQMVPRFVGFPMAYSNWGKVMLKMATQYFEIAVTGERAASFTHELMKKYTPHISWAFSDKESNLPLLKGRLVEGKNLIYVCKQGACGLPSEDIEEVFDAIKFKV